MSKDYQENRKKLGERLKTETPRIPIQEVRLVEAPAAPQLRTPDPLPEIKKDAHVNFWVPDELMERLKIHAAKSRKTIKQIGIEAFEQYLTNI